MDSQLIHGDSFDILSTFPDNYFDAIITDPPYGILNHRIETNIDIDIFMQMSKRLLKENCFLSYFGQQPTFTKWNSIAFNYFNYKNEIIWYKKNASSYMNDMLKIYENIMIVCNGSKRFNDIKRPYTDVKQSLAEFLEKAGYERDLSRFIEFIREEDNYNHFKEYLKTGDYRFALKKYNCQGNNEGVTKSLDTPNINKGFGTAKLFFEGYKAQNLLAFTPHNKQRFNKEKYNIKHPTVKPIALMKYLIELITPKGGIVLDPFGGSGTTALACLETGRRYVVIEKEQEYYEIAKRRIDEWHKENKQLELDVI